MGTNYEHLTAEERATLMVMRADGCSQRAVARCLGRSPSTSILTRSRSNAI
jgi:IS30 family transposase